MTNTTSQAELFEQLDLQAIELPSWAFGNSGTRFRVFSSPGVPRTPFEKIEDAAQVHKFTGIAPSVALHYPWTLWGWPLQLFLVFSLHFQMMRH